MTVEQLCEINDYNVITNFLLGRRDDRYDQYVARVNMLKKAKDVNFIKNYFKENHKSLRQEVIVNLMIAIGEDEFIRECVLNPDYKIQNGIIEAIVAIKNKDIIYELLQDSSLGLTSAQKYSIISKCGDDFIRRCMFSEELKLNEITIVELIEHFGDKYVEEYLETNSFNLSRKGILRLMQDLRDEDYIDKLLESDELTLEEKVQIVAEQSDEYKFNVLKSEKIELSSEQITYIIQCIFDRKMQFDIYDIKKYTLTDNDRLLLALEFNDRKMIFECASKLPWGVVFSREFEMQNMICEKVINLPSEMTIGIEIESEGNSKNFIMLKFNYMGWTKSPDLSLVNGIELQSPILHATPEDSNQIYLVTSMLSGMGQKVSERCGGHIHIGANYLKSVQAWNNFIELWCNTEAIQYAVCNEQGEAPRMRVASFASPITYNIRRAIEAGVINLDEQSIPTLTYYLREMQRQTVRPQDDVYEEYDRNYSINFSNLTLRGIQTIEFRGANGTLDANLWIDNINWYGRMIAVSQELADIMVKENPSEEEKIKLELFNKIKQDISTDEKFELLVKLLGLEPEEYSKRYFANIGFVILNSSLANGFSISPVIIEPKAKPIINIEEIGETVRGISASAELEAIHVMNKSERVQKVKFKDK